MRIKHDDGRGGAVDDSDVPGQPDRSAPMTSTRRHDRSAPRRRGLRVLLVGSMLTALVIGACGDDDATSSDDTVIDDATSSPDDGDTVDVDDGDAFDGEMATLRMVNLVGVTEGGVDVDVVGPGADLTSSHVYGSVAFGEIAEIEYPAQFDAQLVRAGTDEAIGGSATVHDDTEPGQVVVFRDDGASTLGAYHEDRKGGYAPIGLASAIVDDDPNRTWRWSTEDGTCLFSLGNEVPAPMATAADGGDTRGILTLQLVDDFVWYVQPGPQTISFADSAADVFGQGDDCSSPAFDVDIDAEEGKAVFLAIYGTGDDIRTTVYYEE